MTTALDVIRELVLVPRPQDPDDFMIAIAFGWTPEARRPNQDFILGMWIWASQIVYRQEIAQPWWTDLGGEA